VSVEAQEAPRRVITAAKATELHTYMQLLRSTIITIRADAVLVVPAVRPSGETTAALSVGAENMKVAGIHTATGTEWKWRDQAATCSIFTTHKGTEGVSGTKEDLENQPMATTHAHKCGVKWQHTPPSAVYGFVNYKHYLIPVQSGSNDLSSAVLTPNLTQRKSWLVL